MKTIIKLLLISLSLSVINCFADESKKYKNASNNLLKDKYIVQKINNKDYKKIRKILGIENSDLLLSMTKNGIKIFYQDTKSFKSENPKLNSSFKKDNVSSINIENTNDKPGENSNTNTAPTTALTVRRAISRVRGPDRNGCYEISLLGQVIYRPNPPCPIGR